MCNPSLTPYAHYITGIKTCTYNHTHMHTLWVAGQMLPPRFLPSSSQSQLERRWDLRLIGFVFFSIAPSAHHSIHHFQLLLVLPRPRMNHLHKNVSIRRKSAILLVILWLLLPNLFLLLCVFFHVFGDKAEQWKDLLISYWTFFLNCGYQSSQNPSTAVLTSIRC